MANVRGIFFCYFFIVLGIYLPVSKYGVASQNMPNLDIANGWAEYFSETLKKDFSTFSGLNVVLKEYNTKLKTFKLEFEKIQPEKIVQDMAKNLSSMLDSKMEALNRSVQVAEKAASEYVWDPKIEKVDYVSAIHLKKNDSRLVYNEWFKQWIIPNISSVHIPVEIYDKVKLIPEWTSDPKIPRDVQILNGLKWSEALDKVFTANFEMDPEILWQYFGSQTGFMRTLPGSKWNSEGVDLYDVRRRPWYTQGSSSPKDMMIIIDRSGSVHGQALELIKVTVKSLLDTLGENDFVNIVKFSKEAEFVTDCFNGSFVQANFRNKRILIDAVNGIIAESMADFKKGLTFAFEQFARLRNETDRGANCNKMIMLLTDGGSDYAEDVFNKYNPKKNKTYRVFTYAVGPTANPVAAIRWMACANRGYFSQIPAMGAIRSKVQEYVDVISRPLALKHKERSQWISSVYPNQNAEYMKLPVKAMETYDLDIDERLRFSIKHDPLGLGMMTTVTLPVYNRTFGSSNQTILGVMGIDVTTAEMLKRAPLRKLGPNGFTFAINSNGYVVFHPNLRIQGDLKDPPNVDFLEVEVNSDKKEELRERMIDQKTGNDSMDSFTVSLDQRHVDEESGERKRKYYYTGIDKTTFSLGLSIPKNYEYYLKVKIPNFMEYMDTIKDQSDKILNVSDTAILIADWDYFTDFKGNGTILDFQDAFSYPKKYMNKWNHDLIDHLLWDLNVTDMLNDLWRVSLSKGVVGAFVGMNSGLMRIYPKSEDLVEMFKNKRDTWKANYYKRAIDSPNYIFSAPYIQKEPLANRTVGNVMVVKSIDVNIPESSSKYKAAVLGLVFTHSRVLQYMIDISSALKGGAQNNFSNCSTSSHVGCFLLDDGGFLIATNQKKSQPSVGRFFGHVEPEVMKELYGSVYNRLEHLDYQSTCPSDTGGDQTTAAGTLSFNIPSMTLFYEFLTFNWWTSIVTWTFTNLNLYNMMFSSTSDQAEAAYVHPEKVTACIKKHAQYYFSHEMDKVEGKTECQIRNINCSRDFVAVRVKATNLMFVVVEAQKEGCEECRKKVDKDSIIQEAEKIPGMPHFCEIKPRYRRPTEQCYDYDSREDDSKCVGSLSHPVSFLITSVVTMVTTVLVIG